MSYFSTTYRVIYCDTDQMGIVYHANYLKYFEIARGEMLRSSGLTYRDIESRGTLLQVVHCDMNFHLPARYDDLLELRCEVTRLGAASIVIATSVWHAGALLVSGSVKLASVDAASGRVVPMPAYLREAVAQYLT